MTMRTIDRVIITDQPLGRVLAWTKHRRRRVAKKWGEAIIMRPRDVADVGACINNLRLLRRHGVDFTERAERRVCVLLRRSGKAVKHVPRAVMFARMARGLDPLTGRKA